MTQSAQSADQRQTSAKMPRTERGRRTLRKLLDAAQAEFGEKGFHEASIASITRRAGVALGTFYTYFDSKDALFRALVRDLSAKVQSSARAAIRPEMPAIAIERAALEAFLRFAAEHKEVYRIIDESEFVDPQSHREHYCTIAARIAERLERAGQSGEFRRGLGEVEAWAIMGMNVFVGLRYSVWGADEASPSQIAARVNRLLERGVRAD